MILQIPVRQQITLPDAWQECVTPQELSYWLIAKFDEFEKSEQDNEEAIVQIREALTAQANQLQDITRTNNRQDGYITQAQSDIETNKAAIAENRVNIDGLQTLTNAQTTSIGNLQNAQTAQANELQNIERSLGRQDGYITQAQSDIETNKAAIAENKTAITKNTTDIAQAQNDVDALGTRVESMENTPPGAPLLYLHTIILDDVGGSSENTYLSMHITSPRATPFATFYEFARVIDSYDFSGWNQTILPQAGERGFFIGVSDDSPTSKTADFSNGASTLLSALPFSDTVKALN